MNFKLTSEAYNCFSRFLNWKETILPYIWFGSPYFPNSQVPVFMSPSVLTGVLLAFLWIKLISNTKKIKNIVFITRFDTCWIQRQNILGYLPVKTISVAGPTALSNVYYTVQFPKSIWWCCICILTSLFLSYWRRLNPSKHPILYHGQGRELCSSNTLLKGWSGWSFSVGYSTVLDLHTLKALR